MNFHLKLRNPPGTLIYTGKRNKETTIKHIQYSDKYFKIYNTIDNNNH